MREGRPNFFIVGAAKAGTTSMYEYLEQHPDVYMATLKEPHWFSRVAPNPSRRVRPVTSEEEYARLFDGWRGERAVGEASPSYLWDEEAPRRIKQAVPEARIIVLLREPVSRAFSHYLMDVYDGRQSLPFHEALKEDHANPEKGWGVSNLYVDLGLYCEQLRRYFECFGRENVLVLFFEDVFSGEDGPTAALETTLSFLGVKPAVEGIRYEKNYNPLTTPRNRLSRLILDVPRLHRMGGKLLPGGWKHFMRERLLLRRVEKPEADPRAVEFLSGIYEPEMDCLRDLLGRELPWSLPKPRAKT